MMNMNNLAQTHEILTPQLATKVGLTKFEFYKYVKANEYEQVRHGVCSNFAPGQLGTSFSLVLPMPLPPEVAKGIIVLPFRL